jgi:F-type H+-transporting ATPase subunit b
MKSTGIRRKRNFTKIRTAMICCLVVLFFFYAGTALGSSEGGQGETKGWVATDTYRIMNFAVLAIGLFILLRKPLSQALSGRIEGIKNQLSDLEEKKKAAEKELVEFNEKLALLDQEAEKIIEEYIRQGNEAKARILEEAESAAVKLEEQAKRNIENEFKQAKEKLQQDIMVKAIEKAEELIKSRITSADQDKMVDEYLEKVVA